MEQDIELIAEKVHDSWMEEKTKQGFHAPIVHGLNNKYLKVCPFCHTDMYPYDELPENIKEYDRVTVRTVLNAQKSVNLKQ